MYKHSGIEIKENSINHRTRSTKVQGRSPFQDVTNVVDSRISSDAKQDLRITGTKRPISPSGVSIQSSNLSAVHESILPRNASEHKRYHDRERYMRMTPEQREAYLQRNREYKRRRKNHNVCSDGVQSAASQTDKVSDGNMHTTSLAMRPKEVGTLEVSTSDKILRDNIVNPVTGSQIMVNPCDISTLCNTSTAQNKRTSKFLDRCGEYKKIRLSNAEGCSTTTTETHDYVCALEIDQCKRTSTYMDMMSNFSGKRSTNEGCCISARKGIGNLDDQYIPVKMQVRAAVQEHEDHDSIIYVPTGPFPAIEGDSGQADRLIEDDYEDDESCILSGQDSHYLSYEDINHVICEKQVDPGDHIYQNIPSSHHLLEPVPNCAHCGAKRFQYDKPTFCCMGGKVNIVTPRVPDEVRRLYTSQDPDAKYFQDNNGECKYHYPREFSEATLQGKDSYPIYRRRDDGRQVRIRGAVLDNRWVVPYNPYLLMRYNCHINIEVCSSIKAVKYLFKYIYKGHDRASFIVEAAGDKVINEVREYRDARFISPPEAVWRIYSFNLSEMSPPVLQLQEEAFLLAALHSVSRKTTS